MHSRTAWLLACSALALAGGCGGGNESQEAAPKPRIESAVAEGLATRSDEVAKRLESGDSCGAAEEAGRLRDEVTLAINARRIPEPYLEDLSGVVNEIVASIPPCGEPAQPSEGEKKKNKKKDKEDEDGND